MKKLRITIGKKTYDVTVEELDDGGAAARRPTREVVAAPAPESTQAASVPAEASPASAAPGAVVSPMSGVILSVEVKSGDDVKAGQVVAILEAMKMENQIKSAVSGTVQEIEVEAGQSVLEGQTLLVIE